MKSLALSAIIALGSFTALSAQQTPSTAVNKKATASMVDSKLTDSQFDKLIWNSFKINFRTYAYEKLGLNADEIRSMDPIYMNYMSAKNNLIDRRNDLIKEFSEEMSEDNSEKSEENETADFIENYWETDIDQLELKKDYFDKFEDEIGYERAIRFFSLEDRFQKRLNQMMWVESVPTYIIMPEYNYSTDIEVEAYSNWMMDMDGKVDLSHEYTHQGLTQLVKVVESLAQSGNVTIADFDAHKATVMNLADDITENWKETDHADKARKAFITVATMFDELSDEQPFATNSYLIDELMMAAKKLDGSKMLTDQAEHIYNFFEKAERVTNLLANTADNATTMQFMRTRR